MVTENSKPKEGELMPNPAPAGISPGSEVLSQASGASTFWKQLFEEEASVKVKRPREDSPQGEPATKQQGSE